MMYTFRIHLSDSVAGFDNTQISTGRCHTVFSRMLLCMLCYCCTIAYTSAQHIIHTLEAESATLTLPSKIKYVNGYSGNAYVGDNDPGSAMVFNNINMDRDGTYEFRTYYTSMNIRSIAIRSGDYPTVIAACPVETEDWNRPPVGVMITYIYLNAGQNTIRITPYQGGGPNIDKFEIIETEVSMPHPEALTSAFSYDLTDDATITTNGPINNIGNVTDNDESSVYAFSDASVAIDIRSDMPYLLTGYYLSAGIGSSQHTKNWKLEYSADGRIYSIMAATQTDEVENGTFFHVARNPHSDTPKAAKYYRVTAYGGKIGEIQLFGIPYLPNSNNQNFPPDLTDGITIHTNTLGDPPGVYQFGSFDERYFNLFDRNMSTKYYSGNTASFWVDIELDQAAALNYYTLTSCQDYPERDPKSWIIEGFNGDWEVVSEIRDFEFPTRYATMKFYIENSKPYRGYRLRVNQNNGAATLQLLKWQLFGHTETSLLREIRSSKRFVSATEHEIILKTDGQYGFQILEVSGKTVLSGITSTQELRFSVPTGLYIVNLYTSGKIRTEKVTVK